MSAIVLEVPLKAAVMLTVVGTLTIVVGIKKLGD